MSPGFWRVWTRGWPYKESFWIYNVQQELENLGNHMRCTCVILPVGEHAETISLLTVTKKLGKLVKSWLCNVYGSHSHTEAFYGHRWAWIAALFAAVVCVASREGVHWQHGPPSPTHQLGANRAPDLALNVGRNTWINYVRSRINIAWSSTLTCFS